MTDAELLALQAERIADLELDCLLLKTELRILRLRLTERRVPTTSLPALLRLRAG